MARKKIQTTTKLTVEEGIKENPVLIDIEGYANKKESAFTTILIKDANNEIKDANKDEIKAEKQKDDKNIGVMEKNAPEPVINVNKGINTGKFGHPILDKLYEHYKDDQVVWDYIYQNKITIANSSDTTLVLLLIKILEKINEIKEK